jgi:uncharacterized protein YjbI with pentapeptide repeats
MSDGNSAAFAGRYILFMPNFPENAPRTFGGWLAVGAEGSLVFANVLPFDNSAYFDFYWGPLGSVFIQSVATGQYLAPQGSNNALYVNAATTAQASLCYFGTNGDLGTSVFNAKLSVLSLNSFELYFACDNAVPGAAVALVANMTADAATDIAMLCIMQGAAGAAPAPPPEIAARLASVPPQRRPNATPGPNWPALLETRSLLPATPAADGTPPFPYFAGKYVFAFQQEGWVVPAADGTLSLSQTQPVDTGIFNLYMQPLFDGSPFGTWPTVSFQTTPTWGFVQIPTVSQFGEPGVEFGQLGIDTNVTSVAAAPTFALLSMFPQFCGFGLLVCSPAELVPELRFTPITAINNTLCMVTAVASFSSWMEYGLQSSAFAGSLLTRLVPGLQDLLAPGAGNWWDSADLRYVDMTTCVGFLTGTAAQWGNANLSGAILTKMDLTAVTIGSGVKFTNASLAGVIFKSGQDLSHAALSGADLSGGVDLSTVNLVHADLAGANLTKAVLSGVDLSGAICVGTNFTDTDLLTTKLPTATGMLGQGSATGANFTGAKVPVASLASDWRNLVLSTTTLSPLSATVTALRADNVTLRETILDGLTFAPDGSNNGASFQSADLTSASLRGVAAESANFSSAILFAANLTNADLTSTVWGNAFAGSKQLLFTLSPFAAGDLATLDSDSVPADLSATFAVNGHALQNPQVTVRSTSGAWLITDGTNNYSVVRAANALDVLTTGRTSAQFTGATLANANLTGGSFAAVQFGGVQLTGTANASGVDFEQADFGNANISSATPNEPNLQGAYLYGATLDGAFMFNANLTGAYLSPSTASAPATMYGAMLAGATLTGANLDGTVMTGAFIGLQPQGAPSGFSGVPLFTLDAATFTPILNNGANWGTAAPAALQTAFANNGIALSGPAIFTAYPGQAQWGISLTDANLDPPPTPATTGWVWTTFTIMQGTSQYQGTSDLVVYGTMFWMFAPNTTGALQPLPYFVAQTTIGQSDLTPTTYCPNSRTWATNQANGVPWEAAMMPASPTTPQSTAMSR